MSLASVIIFFLFTTTYKTSAESKGWKKYKETLVMLTTDANYTKLWPDHLRLFEDFENIKLHGTKQKLTFPCEATPSNNIPLSVHSLQPGDIKVIAAMGDSITAGNGANAWTPIGALKEYRGHSWSIGGIETFEEDVITLPNILKKYNPSITGYSTGTGDRESSISKLNVAEPGNIVEDMPYQAQLLVDRIKAMTEVNIHEDWKLVTLFIGGNDLCDYCYDEERYAVEKYQGHLREALDILHRELPRTFVNVVSIFDITPVAGLADNVICSAIHWAICNCGRSDKYKDMVKTIAKEYSSATQHLIDSGRYDVTDDFTVVFQPFMRDNDVPRLPNGEPDLSYFSKDCFHFSAKGHNAVAKMLWNAMFEPVGQKNTQSSFQIQLKCPGQNQHLATVVNSGVSKEVMNVPQVAAIISSHEDVKSTSNVSMILGITCSLGMVLASASVLAIVIYKKKKISMQDIS